MPKELVSFNVPNGRFTLTPDENSVVNGACAFRSTASNTIADSIKAENRCAECWCFMRFVLKKGRTNHSHKISVIGIASQYLKFRCFYLLIFEYFSQRCPKP